MNNSTGTHKYKQDRAIEWFENNQLAANAKIIAFNWNEIGCSFGVDVYFRNRNESHFISDLIVLWPLAGTTIVQWIIRLFVLIILCQMNIFDKNLICIWILYIKGKLKTELFCKPFGPIFFFVPSVCMCIVCFYSFISFVRSSHFPLVRYQRVNKTAWNANASNRIISCMFWRILHTIQNNRDIDRKYLY